MKQWKNILPSIEYGLQKMSVVAILLIGTGTIAGIIKNSSLKDWILTGLDHAHMSDALIAPISGALMSAATASTTAGATLASSSFAETILAIGISAVWGAAIIPELQFLTICHMVRSFMRQEAYANSILRNV